MSRILVCLPSDSWRDGDSRRLGLLVKAKIRTEVDYREVKQVILALWPLMRTEELTVRDGEVRAKQIGPALRLGV